jgi:hypothetical protein
MAGRKGIAELVFEAGTRAVARAADAVMSDPRGKEAVARAIGLAQEGRRRLGEAQERVLKAAGIPGQKDYQELTKQLARIKRKARELAEALEAEEGGAGGVDAAAAFDDGAEDALDDAGRDGEERGRGTEPGAPAGDEPPRPRARRR